MFKDGTKLACTNGSLNKEITDKTMSEGYASTLYYVLEDIYGNRTKVDVLQTIISTDKNATAPEKVTVVAPTDLTTTSALYTWNTQDNSTEYTATLYYKETADSEPVVVKEYTKKKGTAKKAQQNFGSDIIGNKKAGFYYVEVFAPGTATSKPSEVAKSSEIEVKNLPSVKGLEYVEENGTPYLKWSNVDYKENEALASIKVEIKRRDGEVLKNSESCTVSNKQDEKAEIKKLESGIIYTASVKVAANANQVQYVDSEEVESEAFFVLGTAAVKSIGNKTVTLSNVPDVKLNNQSATFTVKAVEILEGESGVSKEGETTTIPNLKADKDGNLVITGLKENTKYRIKLECIASDGTTAASGWLPTTTTNVIRTLPKISGTVAKTEAEATEGIFSDGNDITINGEKYDDDDFKSNGSSVDAVFKAAANIVNALKAGDTIDLDLDNMTANITFVAGTDNDSARNFGTTLKDFKVTLTSKDTRRVLTITGVKELTLNSGLYDLTAVSAVESGYIICNTGVDVTASDTNKLKVIANAEVTMDGVVVTPSVDTTMAYSLNKLNIDMTEAKNNIVISNNNTKQALTVNFVDSREIKEQLGTVVVENSGKVEITAAGGSVKSDMTIEVTDGDVDLKNKKVAGGEKTITVNTTSATARTVKGYAAKKLDDSIASKFTTAVNNIDLSTEFDLDDKNTWTNITSKTSWDDVNDADKIKTLIKYLQDNFGSLIGRKVTMSIDQSTANEDSGYPLITITITENTEESDKGAFVITGLK